MDWMRVQFLAGTMGDFCLFTIMSTPALGQMQPPIQLVLEVLSLGIKQPDLEADH
jgi:hypothetical protein